MTANTAPKMTGHLRKGDAKTIRAARIIRRVIGALSDMATRTAPETSHAERPAPVDEPTGLFTAEEMPALDVIEAAAADYERAADLGRRADRGKRAAKKTLDRLPTGLYGAWLVERVPNAREVADLEAIRAVFKAHGLGQVPMKPCAPSLKVTRATQARTEQDTAELLAA